MHAVAVVTLSVMVTVGVGFSVTVLVIYGLLTLLGGGGTVQVGCGPA